jgi:hypothetical protein
MSVPSALVKQLLNCLTLADGAEISSRNVGKELPFYAAENSKTAQISFTLRRKPEIAQTVWYLLRTKRKLDRCYSRYFSLPFSITIILKIHRLFVHPSSGRWTVSPSIRVVFDLRPACFTPFFFNALYKYMPLLNFRPLIFGLKPFGWLRSITLTST